MIPPSHNRSHSGSMGTLKMYKHPLLHIQYSCKQKIVGMYLGGRKLLLLMWYNIPQQMVGFCNLLKEPKAKLTQSINNVTLSNVARNLRKQQLIWFYASWLPGMSQTVFCLWQAEKWNCNSKCPPQLMHIPRLLKFRICLKNWECCLWKKGA